MPAYTFWAQPPRHHVPLLSAMRLLTPHPQIANEVLDWKDEESEEKEMILGDDIVNPTTGELKRSSSPSRGRLPV